MSEPVKRLKDLGKANERSRKAVSDLTRETLILGGEPINGTLRETSFAIVLEPMAHQWLTLTAAAGPDRTLDGSGPEVISVTGWRKRPAAA